QKCSRPSRSSTFRCSSSAQTPRQRTSARVRRLRPSTEIRPVRDARPRTAENSHPQRTRPSLAGSKKFHSTKDPATSIEFETVEGLEPHRDRAAGGHLPVLLPAEDRAADPAEGRRVPHARARRARIMYLHPDPGAGVLRETLAVATSAGFSSTIENSRRRETEDKQLAGGSGPAQG